MFNMTTSAFVTLIIFLVIMWVAQFGMSYLQMQRFYGRMKEIRKKGLTAVGLAGGQYRGRNYAVLTVDDSDRIVHAEQFSGWTVFAKLKPVPQMIGLSVDGILQNESSLPVSDKMKSAFVSAAQYLQEARQNVVASDDASPSEKEDAIA